MASLVDQLKIGNATIPGLTKSRTLYLFCPVYDYVSAGMFDVWGCLIREGGCPIFGGMGNMLHDGLHFTVPCCLNSKVVAEYHLSEGLDMA